MSRDSQTRYISVTAGVDDTHNVTLVANALMKELNKIDLPEGYSIEMTGEDEMIADAMQQLYLLLILHDSAGVYRRSVCPVFHRK